MVTLSNGAHITLNKCVKPRGVAGYKCRFLNDAACRGAVSVRGLSCALREFSGDGGGGGMRNFLPNVQ